MKDIYSYCQGDSHKGSNKPCQDCAFSQSSKSFSIAVVSDGHGGERYFRSQIGSKIVVDVIKKSVKEFVVNLDKSTQKRTLGKKLFADMPFVQYPSQYPEYLLSAQKNQDGLIHDALIRLFSSIISQWNILIAQDAEQNPLTDWEKANVPQKYIDEFEAKRNDPAASLEKFYGCTFMAYVQTQTYWFAFHLGDGKCVMFDIHGGKPRFSQPIPWDEKCFLNKTTSICDSEPLSEIRYCYCGDGSFPEAMFLGSDGIDDSFGDGDGLYNFYIQIYQTLATQKAKDAKQELDDSLPIISQRGSKDDMSVACVYNNKHLERNNKKLNSFQIEKIEKQLEEIEDRFSTLKEKLKGYYSIKEPSDKEKIDCHYAEIDWHKAVELETRLYKKLSTLEVEKTQPARSLPDGECEASATTDDNCLNKEMKIIQPETFDTLSMEPIVDETKVDETENVEQNN